MMRAMLLITVIGQSIAKVLAKPFAGSATQRYFQLLVIACLSGCGWHLQGSTRLPEAMSAIHIDTQDAYSDFYRELRAQLIAAGANVQTQASTARAVVRVKADQTGQRIASVSARNTPEQYEVFYSIEYSVNLAGSEVIPNQRMELTANYSYDSTAVLAKQREQQSMQQALARELAGLVLRRLASVSAAATTANVTPGT
jgi:LPS-assembly lipoprotein